MAACRRVGREQADQHHGRADEGVERQLHGPVLAARGTPDGDEEVFGNDGDFVEDEEQKEIEAEKDAVDAADEREIKREELVGAQLDVPTEENAGDGGEAGEQHEHAADAVGGEQVVNAHRRHPGQVDDDHAAAWPMPATKPCTRQRQPGHSHGRARTSAPGLACPLGRSARTSAPANER